MAVDPLSDALTLTRAHCVISGGLSAAGAWAVRLRPLTQLRLIAVVHGSCRLTIEGVERPIRLGEGDVFVLNGSQPAVIGSELSVEAVELNQLFPDHPGGMVHLSREREVVCVGGHVALDRTGEDLFLAALPPLTHIRAEAAEAPHLQRLLDQLLREMTSHRPGADFAKDHHAQLLLVEVLRSSLADPNSFPAGWLRVLTDERLAPALRLMHAEPSRAWALEELATAAAMSRTTFAARFKKTAGLPPLTYLHHWRIRKAERALREEDITVAALAASLGYASVSAFSNAFKRTKGISPRRYRDTTRGLLAAGES
ncbi:AraC-like DNA-binding protein [Streptomyces umbrinus]|uniref:AraC family transcriptional regulator n=1 Tax=Streptomyces umbrinus TaxID=67370 RepID=UPI00167ED6AC|nr:AraC family transcriptional regulator [Streptomyces umbrinus]MCR3732309.1 AraC-like DNA-binding protein [Streptomyces umbrinus]